MLICAYMFVGCFLWDLGLAYHFLRALTPVPEPAAGAIYALDWYGWIVYLNYRQNHQLYVLRAISMTLAAIAVAIKLLVFRRHN
jgi:hypothetical protein